MRLDPRLLDIFRAVAEAGSATAAAARLNTTQPSITRSIADLERDCGFRLVDRGRFGMRPTPEGDILLASIQRNFAGMSAIERTVSDLREGVHGALWAAAIPVVAEGALGERLGAFTAENPKVTVRLASMTSDHVLDAILSDEVDVGAITGPPPISAALEVIPIDSRSLTIAVSPRHRLANHRALHFRDLDGEAFVQLIGPHAIRGAVETLMISFGVRPRIVHEASTQRAVVQMVMHGEGVGFIEDDVVKGFREGAIIAIPLEPATVWTINLIYRRDRVPSPVTQGFLGWLRGRG
jgi:DNA-binding transcriptional LysR family regulator